MLADKFPERPTLVLYKALIACPTGGIAPFTPSPNTMYVTPYSSISVVNTKLVGPYSIRMSANFQGVNETP